MGTMTTTDTIFQQAESNEPAYQRVADVQDLASFEADEIVIALLASQRLATSNRQSFSLEDSMRSFGIEPTDLGK